MPKTSVVSIGERFQSLVVIQGGIGAYASILCRCDCGNEYWSVARNLYRGNAKSCGCISLANNRQRIIAMNKSRTTSPERLIVRRIWSHMKMRCFEPSHKSYHRYGGRGITVCEEWMDFDRFFSAVGVRPSPEHFRVDRYRQQWKLRASQCALGHQGNNRRGTENQTYFIQLNGRNA